MAKLAEIEGLGDLYARKLEHYGVRTANNLLKKAGTRKGRKELSAGIGISERNLLEWVNQIDLMRLKGISLAYALLLEAVGVDNTSELALSDPQNLRERMLKVNAVKQMVKRVPSVEMIQDWIRQALKAPRMVTY